MYNKFAHACKNAMIRISPGTSRLTRSYTQPRILVSWQMYETTLLLLRLGEAHLLNLRMVVRVTARRAKLQIHRRKCILVVQKEHRAISERDLFMPPLLSETDFSREAYYSRTREHYYGLYSFLDISDIVQIIATDIFEFT